jgi:hypothetical protein
MDALFRDGLHGQVTSVGGVRGPGSPLVEDSNLVETRLCRGH